MFWSETQQMAFKNDQKHQSYFHVTETWWTPALPGAPSTGGDSSRVHEELQDVVQVSASEGAFAAIRADGSVVVWGSAEAGGDATGHLEELLGQFEKRIFFTWLV